MGAAPVLAGHLDPLARGFSSSWLSYRPLPGLAGCSHVSSSQCRRLGFDPLVRKIPWRRKWLPIPVFLPGESHGQRSLWATVQGAASSWT